MKPTIKSLTGIDGRKLRYHRHLGRPRQREVVAFRIAHLDIEREKLLWTLRELFGEVSPCSVSPRGVHRCAKNTLGCKARHAELTHHPEPLVDGAIPPLARLPAAP